MNIRIGIVLMFICTHSFAEPLSTTEQTKQLCAKTVSLFGKEEIEKSYNILKEFWPIPSAEIDNLSYQTKTQLKLVSERFGKSIGTDYINTKSAGSSLIKHTHIVKFEKHAIRFSCTFYKPKTNWLVNHVIWDDQIQLLIE